MAVIKGRIIYNAFYQSVNEMVADRDSEPGYCVSVVEGNEKTEYIITEKKYADSIVLNNGYFARPVVFDNSSESGKKPYHSQYPVEYKVGAIEEGQVLDYADTEDVLNGIFFKSWCSLRLTTQYETIQTKGEPIEVTLVQVDVLRTNSIITKETLTVGDDVYQLSERWGSGNQYQIQCNSVISSDTEVTLTAESKDGTYSTSKTIKFKYPKFYDTITANTRPTSIAILRMNRTFDDTFIFERSYVGTEFFVAIPSFTVLNNLLDENGGSLMNDQSNYTLTIPIGNDSVTYKCYYLPPMRGDMLKIKVVTE